MLGIEVFRRNFYWIANDSFGYPGIPLIFDASLAIDRKLHVHRHRCRCVSKSQILEAGNEDLAEIGVGLIRRSCLDFENVIHPY